jgi:hypothetical protein
MRRPSRGYVLVAALSLCWLTLACAREPAGPLRVQIEGAGSDTRITLVPAPGYRINARLKPALELSDGWVLRLDSPDLTADSSYFTQPPSALVHSSKQGVHGQIRASLCDPGESVCRTVVVEL